MGIRPTITGIFLFLAYLPGAQPLKFNWAKSSGSVSVDVASGIATDRMGNIYAAGYFSDTVDFDPDSSGVHNIVSEGMTDIFILKLDVSGNLVWVRRIGATSGDHARSVAIDHMNNVFVTGQFTDTVDFDPGHDTNYLAAAGESDAFILKLDPEGNFQWAKRFGGIGKDGGIAIETDDSGNIYTTGYFAGQAYLETNSGTSFLSSSGSGDIFILKSDAEGNLAWGNSFGGPLWDTAESLSVDGGGNVCIAGMFTGSIGLKTALGNIKFKSSGQNNGDMIIMFLNAKGKCVWAKHIAGIYASSSGRIKTDNTGNIYIVGGLFRDVDFNLGKDSFRIASGDLTGIFILKLNSTGKLMWVKQIIGTTGVSGTYDLASDNSNTICIAGRFSDSVDFDPGPEIFNLHSQEEDDFIMALDSTGNFLWAHKSGITNHNITHDMAMDGNGNILIAGHFGGMGDYDPGPGVCHLFCKGSSDIVIRKYSQESVGLTVRENEQRITLYPNPVSDLVTIRVSDEIKSGKVKVFTNAGQLLCDKELLFPDTEINIRTYIPGMYLIMIEGPGFISTHKVIKH